MMKPAGLPSVSAQQTLAPIEPRSARESAAGGSKRMRNPWAPKVHYLQDLRTKKTQLF